MSNDLTARIAKYEAKARALLAAGFTTKAGQKEAREACANAFGGVREQLKAVYFDMSREEQDTEGAQALYYGLDYPHQYKAKHSDAIRKHIPGGAHLTADFERLAALTADIKAAPVTPKPPKKLNDAGLPIALSDAFNPALKDEFLKQAPALAAEYAAHVRTAFERLSKQFGGVVPCDPFPNERRLTDDQKDTRSMIINLIGKHSKIAGRKAAWEEGAHYVLNDALLAAAAERYGRAVALTWFYKTNGKLGALAEATLIEDRSGYVTVTGTKADGSKVRMQQQRVIKWAPVARELFAQFPSHLYVDGKFHTAKEYVARFADASEE